MRILLIATLFVPLLAHATGTRNFQVTSYKDFDEGESNGTLLVSSGEVHPGFSLKRLEIPEAVAYTTVRVGDVTYVGTGDRGAIYKVQSGKVEKLVELDAALVTSLIAVGDVLIAATIPNGRLYAVWPDGTSRLLVELDSDQIWTQSWNDDKGLLYLATGPNGDLYSLPLKAAALSKPAEKKSEKTAALWKRDQLKLACATEEKHILALLSDGKGGFYMGTSDQALLLHVGVNDMTGKTCKFRALHDFDADEVKAIVRQNETVYVAVNEFTKSSLAAGLSSAPKGTKVNAPSTQNTQVAAQATGRDRKGRGAVFRITSDGRVEQLFATGEAYLTALALLGDNLYAAAGAQGKTYMIQPDRSAATAFDASERQILAFVPGTDPPAFITGDGASIQYPEKGNAKSADYVSKVFDGQFLSEWGQVDYAGVGKLQLQTRSGNTAKPDRSWSAWQAAGATKNYEKQNWTAKAESPAARYLQLRFVLASADSQLRNFTIYYQSRNQPQRFVELVASEDKKARGKSRAMTIKVRWKVENPDDDELAYRVYFRQEGEPNWKLLSGEEALSRTDYDWNTETMADGYYEVRVEATDDPSNPESLALRTEKISSPVLIDNRKPEVLELKNKYPIIDGRAQDSFSVLTELAYSVDGGEWKLIAPQDKILDERREDFSFQLPKLSPGVHTVAVRAADSVENIGVSQLTLTVK